MRYIFNRKKNTRTVCTVRPVPTYVGFHNERIKPPAGTGIGRSKVRVSN